MSAILVQMGKAEWTTEALQAACTLARKNGDSVALVRLIQVTHPGYLGTELGNAPPSHEEYRKLLDYAASAEDYGVELTVHNMQCVTPLDAVADAAAQLEAGVVFAQVPESRIPYWRKFQIWNLERRLRSEKRQLVTLDPAKGTVEWIPTDMAEAG